MARRPALALGLLLAAGCPMLQRTPLDTSDTQDDGTEVFDPAWAPLVINEFMAVNRTGATDGTGVRADWIELYNPSDQWVSLSGWTLTDDHSEPDRHHLEQLYLAPWGTLLLWADGQPSLGPDHLGFSLAAEGEQIGLYDPTGAAADGLSFGLQAADHAAARALDGAARWIITSSPTPGETNGSGGIGAGEAWAAPPEPCGLGSDLVEFNWLEGDLVTFDVACSAELGDRAVLEPVDLPEGASWDGTTLSWQTGPASGGRIDFVFAVTTEDRSDEIPLAEAVTFWVADDPSNPDNLPVDPERYTEEWGLPVFHITTSGAIQDYYTSVDLAFEGLDYPARIKVRGKTSSNYPKPGYTIELEEAELAISAWGVTRDHLALVTPFDDNAYVRQKLVYDQWAAVAEFWGEPRLVPRSFFTVLYLNGEYLGLFLALDRVDDEFLEQSGFVRGTGLYKAVEHDANFYLTGVDGSPKESLHDGYDKQEGDPPDDFGDLEDLVAFTGHADAQGLVDGAADHIVLQEFMDWFLLVYFSLAEDSGGKNSYLAVAPDSTVFRYCPWDFNQSWGQTWRTYRRDSDELNDHTTDNKVFWAILEVEAARAELWERYHAMAQPGGPYAPGWFTAQLDAYYTLIEPSAEKDWAKWSAEHYSYEGWAAEREDDDDWTDYQGEKAYLYQWIEERSALFEAF